MLRLEWTEVTSNTWGANVGPFIYAVLVKRHRSWRARPAVKPWTIEAFGQSHTWRFEDLEEAQHAAERFAREVVTTAWAALTKRRARKGGRS